MDRAWKSGASGSPPATPGSFSTGYASAGDPVNSIPATKPGAWWYHMVTEELRALVVAAGLLPDPTNTGQILQSLLLLTNRNRTAAEIAAGITPTNYAYPPGHAYRYGTNTTPGTTDMTAALQATIDQAKNGGADAFWPADTFGVTSLLLNGRDYTIRTAGGRRTILKQLAGTPTNTGQIIKTTGGPSSTISGITVGDLAFIGNISTDSGEYHHGIYLFDDALVATIKDIHFGDLYGTNIRGDVFYSQGIAARPVTGIRVGTISGTNVYRNLATLGGQGRVSAIINDGPVGYRDFDIEPNSGGTYQASDWEIGYVKSGIVQITSQDTALANVCKIGTLDGDFNRVAATTPAYPSAPGTNAQALIVNYCTLLQIGYLKLRNYNYIPVTGGTASIKSNIYIEVADIANCNLTEATYKSLFADQGSGGIGYLEIGNLIATLSATSKMVFNGNGMKVRVRRGTVSGGMLASAIPGGIYENLTLDCGSASGNILDTCSGSQFTNITLTNASSATLMVNCTGNTFQNISGTVSAVEGSGCSDNRILHSTLNGVKYTYDYVSGYFITKAMGDANQTLSAQESTAEMIRCSGALTAQRNLVINAVQRTYSVDNSTTGGFGVQVIGPSGTGVVIANGKKAFVAFDGTNVVRLSADV